MKGSRVPMALRSASDGSCTVISMSLSETGPAASHRRRRQTAVEHRTVPYHRCPYPSRALNTGENPWSHASFFQRQDACNVWPLHGSVMVITHTAVIRVCVSPKEKKTCRSEE